MLKAELHVHSSLSDGRDSVKKIVEEAVARKLDVLSITDHDTIEGSLEAMEIVEAEHLPLKIIPGVEITTSSGHLLAYGIVEDVDAGMSMEDSCAVVKKLGGVCFLAHPFDIFRSGSVRLKDFRVVDGVEVYNSKNLFNFLAKKFAAKFNKPGIAGSDAHAASDVGRAVTILKSAELHALFNASYEGKLIPFSSRLAFLLFRLSRRL